MPWWGWLIASCVAGVTVVIAGTRVLMVRQVAQVQKKAMTKITEWPTFEEGPPLPGDAFGPLHRKQP